MRSASGSSKPKPKAASKKKSASMSARRTGPVLLAGGNPQIAKAEGDAPVQA